MQISRILCRSAACLLLSVLFAADSRFTGSWYGSGADASGGRVASQLVLFADGRYQKQDRALASGATSTIYGHYRVFPEQSLLRLDIERSQPAQRSPGESYTFRFSGSNVMTLHLTSCPANLCNWAYRRQN